MPTTYAGNGTIPSATKPWVRVAITTVADTTPIKITATGHGFNTGDTVEQQGTNISAANGLFQITKVDANNYLLNGTTASGAGSGGHAIDMQVQPAVEIPADGELVDASTSGPPIEDDQNKVPYLYRRCGQWALWDLGMYVLPASIAGGIPWTTQWSSTSVPNGTGQTELTSTRVSFQTIANQYAPGGPAPIVEATDWLEVDITGSILVGSNALPDVGSLGLGVTFRDAAANTVIPFTGNQVFRATDQPAWAGFRVTGVCPTGLSLVYPNAFSFSLGYYVAVNSGGTLTLNLIGPLTFSVKHWRLNT